MDERFIEHTVQTSKGTKMPRGDKNAILKYIAKLPPLPEQKAIAHVLGSLDDKIELNRRMNETLEGMAQALFKSWFVDFDPVIDNALAAGNPIPEPLAQRAENRRQAIENGTANRQTAQAFPASFRFTEELGWIPEGWETEPLGEHLDILETGRRPKGGVSKYTSGVPSVGAESIFGVGQFNFGKLKFVPEEFFKTMKSGKVESYDVLLYKDGGKPGEFKPRAGMFGEGFPFESFGINEHVFRIRSESLGQPFLYYQISSERVFHHFAVRGGKAAIPGINQQEVKSVDFLIPNEEAREGFNNFVQPIFEKILKSANQSRMLEQLRDVLLPKLISGELRTPQAEKMVEEAIG
jgi:type I restriction enzyme S subunit